MTTMDRMPKTPNIVYLHSHDSGRHVQPYGYAMPTPHIQRLAEDGVLFRQAFCAAPTCSPARAALLTGMYPHENGMIGLAHRGFALADYGRHIVHTLGAAGYHTVLAGLQHVSRNAAEIGYDEILPAASDHVDDVAPLAEEFLRREHGSPFFLDVGFFETHRPYPEPDPDADDARYLNPPPPLPDTPETRLDMAGYRASVRKFDEGVGMVVDALAEAGLEDDTLVICTTDHGLPFPHMKSNLTHHGLGVMLVLRGPGGFTGGLVSDALVSHLDLFPTVCEVADVVAPDWLRGTSLVPLVVGEVSEVRHEIFAQTNYHVSYEPQRSVRTKRWNYVRRYDERQTGVVNVDGGPSKTLLKEHGWDEQPRVQEMLYDLLFDPNEGHNIVTYSHVADIVDIFRERLDWWMTHTGDPLLSGRIDAPAGAKVESGG